MPPRSDHTPLGPPACAQGVLVRTGVYKEGDETNGAAAVVDGVAEAVDYILAREAKLRAEAA